MDTTADAAWLRELNLPVDVSTLWLGPDWRAPHRTIASHGRSGLRWEFDVETSRLELWVNPQAGRSRDLELRNFSNRDDHTRIFDRIVFTRLEARNFRGTRQYDPLHTILDYGDRALHIAQHPAHSAVIVWCDGDAEVDFKGDKADLPAERGASTFSLSHPDRGYSFLFSAELAPGAGSFQHQDAIARGRSLYCRARFAAGRPLVIYGELAHEPVLANARALAAMPVEELLADAARIVDAATLPGLPETALEEAAEHHRLIRLNRRILWMSQDASGAMRDGPRRIYNLLWVRGGGLDGALAARIGMPEVMRDFLEFTLANPGEVRDEEPRGTMFGCVHGPINKWEEDGLFYVVLGAWNYWTATGDDRYLRGAHRWKLDAALDWLERYCFDPEVGLYGRFHHCETPFEGSHDWTHDCAVGAPFGYPSAKWQGRTVVRSYDVYINLLQYGVLRMLAQHAEGAARAGLLAKAAALAAKLEPLIAGKEQPDYGYLRFADGGLEAADHTALDHTDYGWGLTLPPFHPPGHDWRAIQRRHRENVEAGATRIRNGEKGAMFLFERSSALLATDPAWADPGPTVRFLEEMRPLTARSGRYQCMPGGVPEMYGTPDGEPFHDIKPCIFAVAQWLPIYNALGVPRCAQGWAFRATPHLRAIDALPLRAGVSVRIEFLPGSGPAALRLDGVLLPHTLQLPEDRLAGLRRIEVVPGAAAAGPLLLETDARLLSVAARGGKVMYTISGCGPHRLRFAGAVTLDGRRVTAADDGIAECAVILEGRSEYTIAAE